MDGCFGGNKCFGLLIGALFMLKEDWIAVDVTFEGVRFTDDPFDICETLEIFDMLDPLS